MSEKLDHCVFKVDSIPYCVWDLNLHEKNMEFISSIDPKYFEYLAKIHYKNIESEEKLLASVALRTAYYHGLETLFTLLCATIQAPDCMFGWVLKSHPFEVRNMVEKIKKGSNDIFNKFKLDHISWHEISALIYADCSKDINMIKKITINFSRLWSNFSDDFLNKIHINEYNSIKHGFRTRLGGFSIAVGLQDTRKVPAAQVKMRAFGQSDYGTSFFSVKEIDGAPCTKTYPNFRVIRDSINWNPENMFHGLLLISASLNNVLSYLMILNGKDPNTCKLCSLENDEDYQKPWGNPVGVKSSSMNVVISSNHIRRFSNEEILEELKNISQ